jgi:serine/threonine-protein kinase RsbW
VTGTEIEGQRLCLPPRLEGGGALRRVVSVALLDAGASWEEIGDMSLAVSEAFNNAICHGSLSGDDQVEVMVEIAAGQCTITMEYAGAPFPTSPPTLPPAGEPHGRGRYLMEQLTDRVAYQFRGGTTCVELRKKIRG